jgi:hypothetical protein
VKGQEHLEPVLGYLTEITEPVFEADEARELRVDAEVAVEVGSGRVAAALEVVDLARPPDDFESIVAENVWHRGVVFGRFSSGPPPEAFEARVVVNGEVRDATTGDVDIEETLAIARRLLAVVGKDVEPGDRIAGSILQVPVGSGDEVAVELEGVGCVGLRIA